MVLLFFGQRYWNAVSFGLHPSTQAPQMNCVCLEDESRMVFFTICPHHHDTKGNPCMNRQPLKSTQMYVLKTNLCIGANVRLEYLPEGENGMMDALEPFMWEALNMMRWIFFLCLYLAISMVRWTHGVRALCQRGLPGWRSYPSTSCHYWVNIDSCM